MGGFRVVELLLFFFQPLWVFCLTVEADQVVAMAMKLIVDHTWELMRTQHPLIYSSVYRSLELPPRLTLIKDYSSSTYRLLCTSR